MGAIQCSAGRTGCSKWQETSLGPQVRSPKAPECLPEDLDAHLQRLQLVVQERVKERQKRALQRVIPHMMESFCQGARAAPFPPPALKKGHGKSKGKGKEKVEVAPQQEQYAQLQVQQMEGDEYAGRALSATPSSLLCVHLAHQLCCLHKKCPSCGELLPVATSRLRTCRQPSMVCHCLLVLLAICAQRKHPALSPSQHLQSVHWLQ